jgi:hypothetical protein
VDLSWAGEKASRGSKVSQTDFPINASLVLFTKRDKSILAQISEFLESETAF